MLLVNTSRLWHGPVISVQGSSDLFPAMFVLVHTAGMPDRFCDKAPSAYATKFESQILFWPR